jgi:hypothetical protein
MFRKSILAISAIAVVGAAALAPTAASAKPWGFGKGWGYHHHWHGGFGVYPTVVAGPDCYYVKQTFATPYGYRTKLVQVCD